MLRPSNSPRQIRHDLLPLRLLLVRCNYGEAVHQKRCDPCDLHLYRFHIPPFVEESDSPRVYNGGQGDDLWDLFQANVLALLLRERFISTELVERMREWRHSGFHAYAGEGIPDIEDALRVETGWIIPSGPVCT